MKKVFIMAFMALSLTAMAQHVTPLEVKVAEVDLTALRAQYQSDPIMYRAALESLSKELDKNAAELKSARGQLKVEQAHAKEEGELKGMQKNVQAQQQTLSKQVELNQETRENYVAFLEQQQKELNYSLREVADRQRAISDLDASIATSRTNLQYYVQEVNQKAADLNALEAALKERVSLVKSEQKAAKSMQ